MKKRNVYKQPKKLRLNQKSKETFAPRRAFELSDFDGETSSERTSARSDDQIDGVVRRNVTIDVN